MTKYAITAVALDREGDVTRAQIQQIVGGNKNLPVLDQERIDMDRLALVDTLGHGDDLYALVQAEGHMLPPHRVRVRPSADAIEHIEGIDAEGQVSDALARLPRLPRE